MKDKQILVDGCDVSGCECYSAHREGYCGWFTPCEGDSCQYKLDWALRQLKAKEQECEELKKQLTILDDEDVTVEISQSQFEEYDRLKAENEELKNAVMLKCPQCGEVYLNPIGAKLYETLTEIKEIAEDVIKNVSERCIETTPMYGVHKQILQKISEVIKGY